MKVKKQDESSSQIHIPTLRKLSKQLSAKDIVLLTVKSVEKPKVKLIDIHEPGYVYKSKAYGGAGTNAIAHLMQLDSPIKHLSWGLPADELKTSFVVPMYKGYQLERLYGENYDHLHYFDWMICFLAAGRINCYNMWAKFIQMPLLLEHNVTLPRLSELSTKEDFDQYIAYADNCQ